jgi:hypothetical protein
MTERALLLVMIDVDPAHDDELERWYEEEHFPERVGCPGFLSARRYLAREGEPKYLALYDLESVAVLSSPAYLKIYDPPSPWTVAIRKHFRTAISNVYVDITRPHAGQSGDPDRTGNGLLLVMSDIPSDQEEDFNRWYDEEHMAERMAVPGFLRARRFRAVEGTPRYLALYDLETPDVLQSEAYKYYLTGAGETAWTRRVRSAMQNFRRNVYEAKSSRP